MTLTSLQFGFTQRSGQSEAWEGELTCDWDYEDYPLSVLVDLGTLELKNGNQYLFNGSSQFQLTENLLQISITEALPGQLITVQNNTLT